MCDGSPLRHIDNECHHQIDIFVKAVSAAAPCRGWLQHVKKFAQIWFEKLK